MNPISDCLYPEDLLEMLRECVHRLLLAYNATKQPELWEAFERASDACESLMPIVQDSSFAPENTVH